MQKKKIDYDAYILIAPAFLLFALAIIYPAISTLLLSFQSWNGLNPSKSVGFLNYINLFKDPTFLHSLKITLIWGVSSTVLSVAFGWVIALLAGLNPKLSSPARIAIFMAYGIPAVASGVILKGIFNSDIGMLNGVLSAVGLENLTRAWLGQPTSALWVLIISYVWTQAGLPLLTCYASIRAIPMAQFEAAYIDGATSRHIFRYLMIPYSMAGLAVSIFINLLNCLKTFDLIYVMTGGGPLRSTETIGFFMYQESVTFFKLGYGSASVVIMILMVGLLAYPIIKKRISSL